MKLSAKKSKKARVSSLDSEDLSDLESEKLTMNEEDDDDSHYHDDGKEDDEDEDNGDISDDNDDGEDNEEEEEGEDSRSNEEEENEDDDYEHNNKHNHAEMEELEKEYMDLRNQEQWSWISHMHRRIAAFRDKSVDKWQRKTQVTTGAAAIKGKLHAFNQNVSAQVAAYMRDPSRMIKQMQQRRSTVDIFGTVIPEGGANTSVEVILVCIFLLFFVIFWDFISTSRSDLSQHKNTRTCHGQISIQC
ncbi:nonsense-mediated mRNA decay protein 2-like [Carica papaya]|uniref:nonsense-mediated mRNA decay protein 2-like n=1 Tax=Carica papaya TaxID=3649 RepID=UPI000B8CD90D|nr:nonsense-mediated mRNA decay protein 2-like [Carica papaya]